MTDPDPLDRRKITFAQAEGREPLPQPLRLGEVSQQLRALLWEVFWRSLVGCRQYPSMGGYAYLTDPWRSILYDHHIRIRHLMADQFDTEFDAHAEWMRAIFESGDYIQIFEFIQFVLRHRLCPRIRLCEGITSAIKESRAAYTLVGGDTIYPIASEQEGMAIERVFADLAKHELNGARAHLRTAGELLNKGDFAGSIRESIHAVEAVARTLDPKASSGLAPALAALEKAGAIHGGLKAGFNSIYGYTSDAKGIRHSLVDEAKAPVDQHDAVFMLGACASFITYLVGKATDAGIPLRKSGKASDTK